MAGPIYAYARGTDIEALDLEPHVRQRVAPTLEEALPYRVATDMVEHLAGEGLAVLRVLGKQRHHLGLGGGTGLHGTEKPGHGWGQNGLIHGFERDVMVEEKVPVSGALPSGFLDELSSALWRLGRPQAGVDFISLAQLSKSLPCATSVTVDYTQVYRLAAPLVVVRLQARAEPNPRWAALTPRETEVAQALARGLSNKVIARQLGLSVGTVKDYVHRILTKTGHTSRARLAAAGMPTAPDVSS